MVTQLSKIFLFVAFFAADIGLAIGIGEPEINPNRYQGYKSNSSCWVDVNCISTGGGLPGLVECPVSGVPDGYERGRPFVYESFVISNGRMYPSKTRRDLEEPLQFISALEKHGICPKGSREHAEQFAERHAPHYYVRTTITGAPITDGFYD